MLHQITDNYQRKMWKSMISRKKLEINIWDLIKFKSEKVYYMPYSGIHKFEVNTRYCLKCQKELKIGFRKDEFIVSTCDCANDGKNHATLEKLSTLFDESISNKILTVFSKHKTRKFKNRTAYWIEKGYSYQEAAEKVKEVQKCRSLKSPASKPGARGFSPRTIEYWISKGYSPEEAKAEVSEHQIRNGIDWYIKQYGKEKGEELYIERLSSWLDKMSNLSHGISQVSGELFESVDSMRNGRYGNKESTVRAKKKVYRVDYLDINKRKIIEFYGEYWHADPRKYNANSQIRNKTASDIWKADEEKIKNLRDAGFDVLVIWENDYLTNKEHIIEKCRKFLYEF